jgi:hypothetical protein
MFFSAAGVFAARQAQADPDINDGDDASAQIDGAPDFFGG